MLLAFLLATALNQVCNPLDADSAATLLCFGQAEQKAGEALRAGSDERRRHFEAAVGHYRKASAIGRQDVRLQALTALATLFDATHLDDVGQRESVFRDLVAADPLNVSYVFQLADLQQEHGSVDAAEQTLLDARQRLPDTIEIYRKLAQFYARRVTSLQGVKKEQAPPPAENPGEPDADGVYRVGGQFSPPQRLTDNPDYPDEAQSAGIQGAVQAEIVVGPNGSVTDAKIVVSVPLLDEPALAAVRRWNFTPKVVDGKPVPVRMIVTVRFTLSN